jgi:glycosyltransferase involved in cell wall biosynthesis
VAEPRVSVVVPVRNARDDLARCLDSLARQSAPPDSFEVIVVDDGSDDGTPDVAARRGARVLSQERRGAAAARNRGAREARGEVVLYLDADCVADTAWLAELSRPLLAAARLGGAVGRYESDQRAPVARFVQLDLEGRYKRMRSRDRIDFLNSGNCGLRRELLARYPFDENFQRLEDVELSFRLTADGHAIIFVPEARAWHRHPETVGALVRRKFNYARYAFPLYRQYPGKAASDASTPQERRARLASTAAFLALLPFAWLHPVVGTAALAAALLSLATSWRLLAAAFGASPAFGLACVAYLVAGNVAFVAGAARGLLAGKPPEAN